MLDIQKRERINTWLMMSYVFFLPMWQQLSVLSLILLLVFSIFTGALSDLRKNIRSDKILWLFIGYYVLHLLGMLYSENIKYGLFDLQVKIAFLVFPIILPSLFIRVTDWNKIAKAFIAGVSIAAFYCFGYAFIDYIKNGNTESFFYLQYSRFLHTTYFSLYINFAILLLLHALFSGKTQVNKAGKFIVPLILYLSINILLLSSRTATAGAYLTIPLWLILSLRKKIFLPKNIIPIIICLVFIGGSHAILLRINNRFTQVENTIKDTNRHQTIAQGDLQDTLPVEEDNSTNIRVHLWKNAVELIADHPFFGVGTGDIKEEIVKYYTKNNYAYGIRERISPHNQFLHTGVILGFTGILFLASLLLIPMFLAIRSKDWLYFCFLLIILLNCMTESVLEIQKGILFFAFFNVMLYLRMKKVGGLIYGT